MGVPPPPSPTHHQGEQEEERGGQVPQQSFIILNPIGEEERKGRKKKGENTNPIIHTTEWGWYRHEAEAWGGPLGVGAAEHPHIPFSL